MAKLEFGCCEAKQAHEKIEAQKQQIHSLILMACVLFLGVVATAICAAYADEKINERLLRLEKVVGMDEIGRRK
jgi:hypothetical protein